MTKLIHFTLKFFVAVVFFVAMKMYAGIEAGNIVQVDTGRALFFACISLSFLGWGLYPFIGHWIFSGPKKERHHLTRITEDRITEEAPAYMQLPAPRHKAAPNVVNVNLRASRSNRAITPQQARRKALQDRFSTESLEAYERYLPYDKHRVYTYEN